MRILMVIKRVLNRKRIQRDWRKNNTHNFTTLSSRTSVDKNESLLNHGLITVGKYSYGELNVSTFGNAKEKLIIGNYCSIGGEVLFLLGGEHNYKSFTTYPFSKFFLNKNTEAICKGPIIVDDDVWIGQRATIMSGVKIGKGAIIAAGALVTKDVPAYAIVGGVPARILKYRFDKEIIQKLKEINFNNLEPDIFMTYRDILSNDITINNVDEIVSILKKETY